MAFLIGPALSFLASKLLGSEEGLKKVKSKRKLVIIHEGELVAPKKLANKLRKDPKYKKDIGKLPSKPQKLSKGDINYLAKGRI